MNKIICYLLGHKIDKKSFGIVHIHDGEDWITVCCARCGKQIYGKLIQELFKDYQMPDGTPHWVDGICKTCESQVLEMPSDKHKFDYMNICSNRDCKHHEWHYVGDTEFLDYYEHGVKK